MAATKYDFNIEQGTSFRLSLVYKDDSGNPIDLTNWCARVTWTTDKNITQTFLSTNTDLTLYKFTIEPLLGKLNYSHNRRWWSSIKQCIIQYNPHKIGINYGSYNSIKKRFSIPMGR